MLFSIVKTINKTSSGLMGRALLFVHRLLPARYQSHRKALKVQYQGLLKS